MTAPEPVAGTPLSRRLALSAVLALIFLVPTALARRANGITFDETFFLGAGLQAWRAGDLSELVVEHVAPLPILIAYAPVALSAGGRARFVSTPQPPTTQDLYRGRPGDPPLVARARLTGILLLGLPLVLAVQAWLARRIGPPGATLAAAFAALSPTLLAHASLATTDVGFALFGLLLLAALARHRDRGTRGSAMLVGVALGLGLATKLSTLAFLPLAVWQLLRAGGPRPREAAGRALAGLLLAFLVAWAVWGFGTSPDDGRILPAPVAALEALRGEAGQLDQFLLGVRSRVGWPYYFAVTFLLKSTPAELLVAVLGLAAGAGLLWRARATPDERLWLGAIACVAGASALAPFDIGHRHVLVLYPLLALVVASWLARRVPRRRVIALALALLALQATEAIRATPRPIAYFNDLAGDARTRHGLLVDSNLDWGQDLPRLRAAAQGAGCRSTALFYFGTASPEAYGLARSQATDPECAAISVTLLEGVHVPDDRFAAFRDLPEAGRAGDSILLYRTDAPGVASALAAARASVIGYRAETATGVFRFLP